MTRPYLKIDAGINVNVALSCYRVKVYIDILIGLHILVPEIEIKRNCRVDTFENGRVSQ